MLQYDRSNGRFLFVSKCAKSSKWLLFFFQEYKLGSTPIMGGNEDLTHRVQKRSDSSSPERQSEGEGRARLLGTSPGLWYGLLQERRHASPL